MQVEQEDESHKEFLDRRNAFVRDVASSNKMMAMMILGGPKCVQCGFADMRALDFDHINNDGFLAKAKKNGNRGKNYNRQRNIWIIENPEEARKKYQILCANCNRIKAIDLLGEKTKNAVF